MANLNKVMLIGNLTRDPEVKVMPSGTNLASFSIAVNRNYTTAKGEKQEETTYIEIESWGKQAETIAKYMKKGRPIYVEGRLKLDKWEDKETKKTRSAMRVVLEDFQFIDTKGDKTQPAVEKETDTVEVNEAMENLVPKKPAVDSQISKALREFRKTM